MVRKLFTKLRDRRNRNKFREYGYRIKRIDAGGRHGTVEYAKWLHPLEISKDFNKEHVRFVERWVKPGDFVIDIGAFTGDTTLPMALAAGPRGLALALEPNPYVFKLLKQNAELNARTTNIDPLCAAAADHDGTMTFDYSDASYCNGGYLAVTEDRKRNRKFRLDVKGVDLERLLRTKYAKRLPRLSFVKVDAEGYDKEIIKNLQGLLREYRPYLITECFQTLSSDDRRELYDVLTGIGYVPYYLKDFGKVPTQKLTPARMNRLGHFDIFAAPQEKALRAGRR